MSAINFEDQIHRYFGTPDLAAVPPERSAPESNICRSILD